VAFNVGELATQCGKVSCAEFWESVSGNECGRACKFTEFLENVSGNECGYVKGIDCESVCK
jgi:hypothetical protein